MQQQRQPKKQKPVIPLMELLAINATGPSRQLLKKYGKSDAKGYGDLQTKLSDLYRDAKDKIEIEKEFAEIHPHKEFILKYLTPPPSKTNVIIQEPTSPCEGNPQCNCEKKSNAEGSNEVLQAGSLRSQQNVLIASVAIVAIVGLVIYIKK